MRIFVAAGGKIILKLSFQDGAKSKLSNLRSYQKQAFNYILDGKDCFLSQPTGSGKSLVFQALPYCFFVDKQPEELVKKSTSEEILTRQVVTKLY